MIQVKHVAPMRCKILWALGFTSSSRIFARCDLGVKPYKGCERCENNVGEQYIEAVKRGMSDGLKQRKELLLKNSESFDLCPECLKLIKEMAQKRNEGGEE